MLILYTVYNLNDADSLLTLCGAEFDQIFDN